MAPHFPRIAPAWAAFPLALACVSAIASASAPASALDGCWKMVPARAEGKATPDCIRVYKDTTLVTSCRGGKDVSVYALADMNVSAYSFQQVGRYVDGREARVEASSPRAAAFLVKGQSLFMVLARSGSSSGSRIEQQLARLQDKDCEGLRRYLPKGGPAATADDSRP